MTSHRLACAVAALSLLFASAHALPAQTKRALSHDDYDAWQSIRGTAYSPDGAWIAYSVAPQWGDGALVVRHVESDTTYRHARGGSPTFSADSRFVVFSIAESKVEERAKKLAELEKGKTSGSSRTGTTGETAQSQARGPGARRFFPGMRGPRGGGSRGGGRGDLGVMDLATGQVEVVERVKGFRVSAEAPFLV